MRKDYLADLSFDTLDSDKCHLSFPLIIKFSINKISDDCFLIDKFSLAHTRCFGDFDDAKAANTVQSIFKKLEPEFSLFKIFVELRQYFARSFEAYSIQSAEKHRLFEIEEEKRLNVFLNYNLNKFLFLFLECSCADLRTV